MRVKLGFTTQAFEEWEKLSHEEMLAEIMKDLPGFVGRSVVSLEVEDGPRIIVPSSNGH